MTYRLPIITSALLKGQLGRDPGQSRDRSVFPGSGLVTGASRRAPASAVSTSDTSVEDRAIASSTSVASVAEEPWGGTQQKTKVNPRARSE